MSRLDEKAKPILTPLILGNPTLLDEGKLQTFAAWAALKMIVCEFAPNEQPVTTTAQRTMFMINKLCPPGWKIYIAKSSGDEWRAQFTRHSVHLGPIGKDGLPTPIGDPFAKNTQFVLLGIGQLMIVAISTTVPDLDLSFHSKLNLAIRRVQPFNSRIIWPPLVTLSDSDIDNVLANTLGNYLQTLKWAPGRRT